jgi:hypothetical protein
MTKDIKKYEAFPSQKADIISWEAHEYPYQNKSPLWYLIFSIISTLLLVFALFTKSIITVITFSLIIILVYVFAKRKPNRITYQLAPNGILAGNMLFPYKNIKAFWVFYNPPHNKTLNLETTALINNHVVIQLGDQEPVAVKLFLRKYIFEDTDKEEGVTDVIARKLKL